MQSYICKNGGYLCKGQRYMLSRNRSAFKLSLAVLVVVVCLIVLMYNQAMFQDDPTSFIHNIPGMTNKTELLRLQQIQHYVDPWSQVPQIELFLRTFYDRKGIYEQVLVQSMGVFWPANFLKMVIVLDGESHADHKWGTTLTNNYPYPRVMFENPSRYYHNDGHSRQQLTILHADLYSTEEYVGFIDTDTIFVTPVTPSMLFEDGKPIIIGQIGVDFQGFWKRVPAITALWFKHKEVMRCMSYFPVIIKVQHIVELRRRVEEIHNKTFDEVYEQLTGIDGFSSQFSIICQFLWLYHRDEYKFYFHNLPSDNWTHVTPGRVPKYYYKSNTRPEQHIPRPRVAAHWGYPEPFPPSKDMLNFYWLLNMLTTGFCYSIGMKYCPEKCPGTFNNKTLQRRLFLFEGSDWSWHPACLQQQQKHYKDVDKLIQYYNDTRQPVLGASSIEDACHKWPYNFVYSPTRPWLLW